MESNETTPPDYAQSSEATNPKRHDNYNIQSHDFLTIYTSGQPVNKRFFFNFMTGKIEKSADQSSFFKGMAIKKYVPTLPDLAPVIEEISENPHQCLGLGFHPTAPLDEPYQIISETYAKKGIETGSLIPNGDLYIEKATGKIVACRLKCIMSPSSYILFDKDDGNADLDQWVAEMASFIPDFDKVDKIIIPSNSSRVGLASNKWHCYVRVDDAMDIYDLGDRLLSAGHAAGHGIDKVSKGGAELSRIITDCAVFSPERLIYDGKPIIEGSV